MQVNVRFLENLRIEASFDDFSIIADQPIRYKGDGTAPGPYDYFLASSAMCAAYFVKVYCNARDISTEDIKISQNNIIDPNNRYNQTFDIQIEVPAHISDKDKEGMLKAMDRCTVKRVIQNSPGFKISPKDILGKDSDHLKKHIENPNKKTIITGKDSSLEETIENITDNLNALGINIEIASWRNIVPHVWSVHIRDADSPMCYTNGKGSTKEAALCSALGEYMERISNNYFYNDYYLGQEIAEADFVHYPNEKWFQLSDDDTFPSGLMDDYLFSIYNSEDELKPHHLIDTNSGNAARGICAIPFTRQSDKKEVHIPVNLIGNLFVSNGMSAGNTKYEARVQCLSEIFERAIKNKIISEELSLPDVPQEIINRFPKIVEGIQKLESQGFPIFVKDASLGGKYPVMCVVLMNPKTGGVFASFGAHPNFEVALERSLTELLQGRSFEGMNDVPVPTFNSFSVTEHNNIVDHFIDSTGVISWRFFNKNSDFKFVDWNFNGSTIEEFNYLMEILNKIEKEVYIADYNELGTSACRILVPDYSEIYLPEDLVWDNNNQALLYREDILNIHDLNNDELKSLVFKLEESEIDNYTELTEIIGIAFDENSTWGQMTIGELKGLIYLSLQELDEAKQIFEMYATFNDSLPQRKKFYRLINILLDIKLDESLDIKNYEQALKRMYGTEFFDEILLVLTGKTKFYNLSKTNMNLANQEKHLKLIQSYKKLMNARVRSIQ